MPQLFGGADGAVSVAGRLEPPVCASTLQVGGSLERREGQPAVAILVWAADQLTSVPTALLVRAAVGDRARVASSRGPPER